MDQLKRTVKDDLWIVLLDILAVNISYLLALAMRYYVNNEIHPGMIPFINVFYYFAPWYTLACLIIFACFKLYGGLWRYAGINDMNRIIVANLVTVVVQLLGTILFFQRMPLSYYAFGAFFQLILIALIRFSYRIAIIEKRNGIDKPGTALVVGAGDLGRQTIRVLEDGVAFRVGGVVDTEDEFIGKMIDGVPVYGINQLRDVLERHDVNCVFLAEPALHEQERAEIKTVCDQKKIDIRDYTSFFSYSGESDQIAGMENAVKGPSGNRSIPFSPPDISESEIGEVVEALKSGWITTGPRTKLLERRLAAYIETGKTDVDTEAEPDRWSNRVVCLNSATAAEELNLRILGIREGDEVIVPAYTYTASASAAIHCGATVVLVDIQKDGDRKTHCPEMDYTALESAITERTKAIIAVDLGGVVCDYDRVFEIVNRKRSLFTPTSSDGSPLGDLSHRIQLALGRVAVVADCAHALGASRMINGQRTYCGAIADFTSFSFHAVKNFTTAEGGASTWRDLNGVSNAELYKFYQLLSLHGQNKDALAKTKVGAWEYDIIGPWYKCNMTDIMAAIGLRQLDRYPGLLERRVEIISRYDAVCDELGISHLIHHTSEVDSSNHLYLIRVPGIDVSARNEIIEKLAACGIATNVHYKPMPMMTAYKALGWDIKDFPNTYDYYQNLITLPLHTKLSDEDTAYICDTLKEILPHYIKQ